MSLLSKIHDFLRGNKGTGNTSENIPLQEGHELKLEEEIPTDNLEVQTTFNTDDLDVLVEEGEIENVYNED